MFNEKEEAKSINLLEPVGSGESVGQISISWLTTIGKWMLIIVEIISLAAFGYRFVMDGKNNDLTEQINSQVSTLENATWKKSIVRYGNYQTLLTDVKTVRNKQEINSNLISEVINGVPLTLNVESISINNGKVSLSIKTTDFNALRSYEENLKNNTYYSDVRVNINMKDVEYDVSISFNATGKVE
ncbi:MAG TPA: hypothetical protein PLK49_01980 [Candidatus Dojkabacteria bacterium]|nr:hypothetical protein [Candidatus Dojkabacteria bacterium]HPM14152.1 hypothetical protein [Candidatus Dojkabacteria bacterium]